MPMQIAMLPAANVLIVLQLPFILLFITSSCEEKGGGALERSPSEVVTSRAYLVILMCGRLWLSLGVDILLTDGRHLRRHQ